jgi:DNA gyrase/topoisomerase IV subunit A
MQLRRLSKLDETQLRERQQTLQKQIDEMKEILSDTTKIDKIIRKELLEIKRKYASPRKTRIQVV